MTHLVDKSLVVAEKGREEMRYKLLETVREYACTQMREVGEGEGIRERHLDFYLELAEKAEPELVGPQQKEWLDKLELEHENLRIGLKYDTNSLLLEKKIRLAISLEKFWEIRGYWVEGNNILLAYQKFVGPIRNSLETRILFGIGILAFRQGNYLLSKEVLEKNVALCRIIKDQKMLAYSLLRLGVISFEQGEFGLSKSYCQNSFCIMQRLQNNDGTAQVLNILGNIEDSQGNYVRALSLYKNSLALMREIDNKQAIAGILNNLGALEHNQGNFLSAQSFYNEGLDIMREIGDKGGITLLTSNLGEFFNEIGLHERAANLLSESLSISYQLNGQYRIARILNRLALVARDQGNYIEAKSLFRQSMAFYQTNINKCDIALSLEDISRMCKLRGYNVQAIKVLGSASLIRDQISAPVLTYAAKKYDSHISALRSALGDEAFEKYWAQGRAMSMDEAIAYALSEAAEDHSEENSTHQLDPNAQVK